MVKQVGALNGKLVKSRNRSANAPVIVSIGELPGETKGACNKLSNPLIDKRVYMVRKVAMGALLQRPGDMSTDAKMSAVERALRASLSMAAPISVISAAVLYVAKCIRCMFSLLAILF